MKSWLHKIRQLFSTNIDAEPTPTDEWKAEDVRPTEELEAVTDPWMPIATSTTFSTPVATDASTAPTSICLEANNRGAASQPAFERLEFAPTQAGAGRHQSELSGAEGLCVATTDSAEVGERLRPDPYAPPGPDVQDENGWDEETSPKAAFFDPPPIPAPNSDPSSLSKDDLEGDWSLVDDSASDVEPFGAFGERAPDASRDEPDPLLKNENVWADDVPRPNAASFDPPAIAVCTAHAPPSKDNPERDWNLADGAASQGEQFGVLGERAPDPSDCRPGLALHDENIWTDDAPHPDAILLDPPAIAACSDQASPSDDDLGWDWSLDDVSASSVNKSDAHTAPVPFNDLPDLIDLPEFDAELNQKLGSDAWSEATPLIERTRERAAAIAALLDVSSRKEQRVAEAWLNDFFLRRPAAATFRAIEFASRQGLDLPTLRAMDELRQVWEERPEYWLMKVRPSFMSSYSTATVRLINGASALNWTTALKICRARADLPPEDMIDPEWLDEWLARRFSSRPTSTFAEYVGEKVGELASYDFHVGMQAFARTHDPADTLDQLTRDLAVWDRCGGRPVALPTAEIAGPRKSGHV